MAIDLDDRLQKISAAIDAILVGGQDVMYDGNRVTHADLEKLQKMESTIEARIKRRTGGGIRVRGGVPS